MTAAPGNDVFDFKRAMTEELVTHTNVKQELVITTVDKLKLCLLEHKDHLYSRREWLGPAGILLALVATLVAADFTTTLGLDAPTWHALFLLSAIFAAGFTVVLAIRAVKSVTSGGIDTLIDRIADRSTHGVSQEVMNAVLADLLKASGGFDLVDDDEETTTKEDET